MLKKMVKACLAITLSMGLLVGCAGDGPGTGDGAEEGGDDSNLRILLLVPGTLGDKSFFDSANEGMKLAAENYDADTKVVEMGTDTTKYSATLDDVCNEGWDIIVTGGSNISQPLQEAALDYPKQQFILYDEAVDFTDGANSNIYCMTYKCNEGGYLAGVLAASMSETGKVGFAGGYDIPLINDWLVGYIEGVQSVNPEVKVSIGYMNSFTDAAKGKEVGLALYNGGTDIIFQAAGGAGLGIIDAAKEAGKYAIGTDSDQSEMFASDAEKANAIYASILKRVDLSIEKAIGTYIDGGLSFGSVDVYGLAEGCVEITDNSWYQENVPQEVKDAVESVKQEIINGDVTPVSVYDMTDDEILAMKAEVQP